MNYRQIILDQREELALDNATDYVQREKKEDIKTEGIDISVKPVVEWIFEQQNKAQP